MCPAGTEHRAHNLNRANLGLISLTISPTKNTLDVTNEDWMVRMEDFVVSLNLLSTRFTNWLYNQPSGLNNLIYEPVL